MGDRLKKTEFAPGRITGASPSENRYYVLILFDISNQKKYRALVKILKRYGLRIQKSVFEAQLKTPQIRDLVLSIEALMGSERFYDPGDNVRVYKIAGNCDVVAFGSCGTSILEENIFF
ncbi:CRISPR-associated endonuclease Cas2 [Eggerthellaceae bacterium zg-887]|uniref:CRISPR-associated endonuclease Cas2 n=1 Tax=Xiamenia xianingshaonis TaxID=2682776 RepID=UPI00140DE22B|nr:CRISPR-associated endonuclease Cas2 [Xiamenia xianingshaonis]NHM16474.1 CRISPR-associated endonuclease Cas2 [Xiamenia xianingshaonis]